MFATHSWRRLNRRWSTLFFVLLISVGLAACSPEGDEPENGAAAPAFSGSGDDSTEPFEVAENWELTWEAEGAFQVDLLDAEGNSRGTVIESEEGGEGGTFISEGGSFTLDVTADGAWEIEIVDRSAD